MGCNTHTMLKTVIWKVSQTIERLSNQVLLKITGISALDSTVNGGYFIPEVQEIHSADWIDM